MGNPERIERQDVEKSREFLKRNYEEQLKPRDGKDSNVTPEIVQSNLAHADRVTENAKWIAFHEKLDSEKLQLAAICHDCGKLGRDFPGGIDTFNHHLSSALQAKAFLRDSLNKKDSLVKEIGNIINRHSHIPFILERMPNVPPPITKEDFALRDADVLDQMDIHGLRKIVEIRQNPQTEFYKNDGGDLWKAISSALATADQAEKILETATAKKIGASYKQRLGRLITALRESGAKTLDDFKKTFENFSEKESEELKKKK